MKGQSFMAGVFTTRRDTSKTFIHTAYNGSRIQVTLPLEEKITGFRSGRGDRSPSSNEELMSSFQEIYARSIRSKYDTGHEMSLTKTTHKTNVPRQLVLPYRYWANGTLQAGAFSGDFYMNPAIFGGTTVVPYPSIPAVNLDGYGSKAIAATIPTSPAASLASFTGEFARDGVPEIIGSIAGLSRGFKDLARNSGKEFLNLQFGWVPFLSDITKLLESVINSRKIIDQFLRDSDQWVRRRYDFPSTRTTTQIGSTKQSGQPFYLNGTGGPYSSIFAENYDQPTSALVPVTRLTTVTRTVSERYWFSGAYSYHVSSTEDFIGKLRTYEQLANKLLGTRITPETLWELAPWSWLTDWWVDISSFTGNAVAFESDRLVLRYGYLMRTYKVSITQTVHQPNFQFWKPAELSTTWSTTRKERFRSTPYGFGLNPSSFSTRRWAVLGSLGMTKGPRSLR